MVMQMHPNIKAHNKPNTPTEWVRFPWERNEEIAVEKVEVTAEQIEQLNALKQAFFKR